MSFICFGLYLYIELLHCVKSKVFDLKAQKTKEKRMKEVATLQARWKLKQEGEGQIGSTLKVRLL